MSPEAVNDNTLFSPQTSGTEGVNVKLANGLIVATTLVLTNDSHPLKAVTQYVVVAANNGVVQLPVAVVATGVPPNSVVYQRYCVGAPEPVAPKTTLPGPQIPPSVTAVITAEQLATTVKM